MVTRNISRLEKLGLPLWVRGLSVAMLMLIVLGTLTVNSLRSLPHGGRVYGTLAFLWMLAIVALLFLLRRRRAQTRVAQPNR